MRRGDVSSVVAELEHTHALHVKFRAKLFSYDFSSNPKGKASENVE